MANKPIDKTREHLIGTVTVKVGQVKDRTVNILYWPGYGVVMPSGMTTNGNVWHAAEFIRGQGHYKRELERMEVGVKVTVECTVLKGEEFVPLDYTRPAAEIKELLSSAARQFDGVE